ncbi:MAG: hypothetical protein LBR53_13695 [Deltaproteobacteria bacterium]|jgi:hypothetical protein|nr:hypothetical protein [Deltaproteobacteria bacterium]
MKTFSELFLRLSGLAGHLGGGLWEDVLSRLNPPESAPADGEIQEMAFRDAKAMAGYVPDLRRILASNPPGGLGPEERLAFGAVYGFYNLTARIPVVLLTIEDHRKTEQLVELYNGFRQVLLELKEYGRVVAEKASGKKPAGTAEES